MRNPNQARLLTTVDQGDGLADALRDTLDGRDLRNGTVNPNAGLDAPPPFSPSGEQLAATIESHSAKVLARKIGTRFKQRNGSSACRLSMSS